MYSLDIYHQLANGLTIHLEPRILEGRFTESNEKSFLTLLLELPERKHLCFLGHWWGNKLLWAIWPPCCHHEREPPWEWGWHMEGGQRGEAKRPQVLNGIHHPLNHPTHEAKLLLDIPLIWINKSSLSFKRVWIVFSITYMEPTVISLICKVHSSFGLSEISDLFANLSHLWRRKDLSLQVSAAGIHTLHHRMQALTHASRAGWTGQGTALPHQEAPLSRPSCSSWPSPPGNGGVQACRVICHSFHSSPHTTLLWISYNIDHQSGFMVLHPVLGRTLHLV